MKKNWKNPVFFIVRRKKLFLSLVDGNLAEFFEVLHEDKSGLAGAGTGGLVSLGDLSIGVDLELSDFSFDLFYKLFHNSVCISELKNKFSLVCKVGNP